MRIVVADDLPKTALELLRRRRLGRRFQIRSITRRTFQGFSRSRRARRAQRDQSHADIIAAGKKLRAIARAGTGVDNVNVEAASARGIVVMNAPGANSISVAELAMAQLLSLARKLPAADASMKQGKWDKKSFLGEEVRGKVLGLAGLGRIGQEVARRAQAFEMTRDRARSVHCRQRGRRTRHRAGVDGRFVRARGLPVAPHAGDAANPAHLQRRAAREVQEGPEDHQHRPRRADRRAAPWSKPSRAATSAARPSTSTRPSRPPTIRCSSCRRSWPARTLPPRPRKARSWSASKRRRRCAIS